MIAPGGAAVAAPAMLFDIPAGPLQSAVVALGVSGQLTVGIADPALGEIIVRPVKGRMTVREALSRMLAGSDAVPVQVDDRTYRIERRRADAKETTGRRALPTAPRSDTIVVTGSKRTSSLDDYAGSVSEIDTASLRPGSLAHGSEALVARLPVLTSTHLGPGRNKLFIRGIADSSFNGPTQATVGQYLGDIRLNYSAPDPDLALYDIRSVEVLEGPQGTLYGAGSLGGVIRLQPNAPDLSRFTGSLSAGVSATAHGAMGADGAAVLNLPLVTDRLGLRVVAYGDIEGGYIDDPARGRSDINRTTTRGGRATLRLRPSTGWTIDLGGVLQNINSRDGQYAILGLPPLERTSVVAQPFDNDYALASLVVRHAAGNTTLTSATSAVFHDVGSTYDASSAPARPSRYREDHRIMLLTNETRLAHRATDGGGWVVGAELLRSSDRLERTLGPPGAEASLSGTSNVVEEASAYGEATLGLGTRWFVTGGGRVDFTRQVGHMLDGSGDAERRRHDVSLLPSVGLAWTSSPRLSLYARYQEGYRPGGLTVQAAGVQRFEADSVATWEGGVRYGAATDRFSGHAAVSYAHWEDIQADLVDAAGLPYTANIGFGRVLGLELQSRWQPIDALTIEGALFLNDSNLSKPAAAFTGEKDATLPNIAGLTAHAGFAWRIPLAGRPIELTGSVAYVGRSKLGVGPLLDQHQGDYADTALGLSVPIGRAVASLDITNLLDTRGNIFALGDPFGVAAANQITPLRPRTVRLGASLSF